MKSVYIALGYGCNHRCVMCPLTDQDRNSGMFSYDYILSLLSNQELSVDDHVTLSGGEPTLCEYLYDLIEMLCNKGLRITLLTNCSGFSDFNNAHELFRRINPAHFNVVTAIHSADAKLHDKITGVDGSFEQSIKGLHNLLDAGVNITIKHIITALTYRTLPEFSKMICREFPPKAEVQFTSADYSGNALKNADMLAISFAESQQKLDEALYFLTRECIQPYKVSLIEMPLCASDSKYWQYFRITGDKLDLYVAPNAKETGGVMYQMANGCAPMYPECENCSVRCFCPGAWNTAYNLIGNKLLRSIKCSIIDNSYPKGDYSK